MKWRIGTGIALSAVVFGISHFVDVASATDFGLLTALLYFQSRTLIVPIAFHAAYNLVVTVAGLAVGWDEIWKPSAELAEIEAMTLPSLAMMAVTLPVLVWYIRRNWPSRDAVLPYLKVDSSD